MRSAEVGEQQVGGGFTSGEEEEEEEEEKEEETAEELRAVELLRGLGGLTGRPNEDVASSSESRERRAEEGE